MKMRINKLDFFFMKDEHGRKLNVQLKRKK